MKDYFLSALNILRWYDKWFTIFNFYKKNKAKMILDQKKHHGKTTQND
jgi:hypothetical protein